MKQLLFAILTCGLLCACTAENDDSATGTQGSSGEGASISGELEAGCGMCVYQMAGVNGCKLAVKVGDKPLLVEGFQPKQMWYCKGAKKCNVEGKVEGDKFLATKVEPK